MIMKLLVKFFVVPLLNEPREVLYENRLPKYFSLSEVIFNFDQYQKYQLLKSRESLKN